MADTVAKNHVLGMKGVGGYFGCSHCRIEVLDSNLYSGYTRFSSNFLGQVWAQSTSHYLSR